MLYIARTPSSRKTQTSLDAQYVIYDGGMADIQKQLEESSLLTEQKKIEVNLENLKPQVNELYFGVLMLQKRGHHHQ